MNYHSKSQYHDAFAAIAKITLRDGDNSSNEVIFLEHLKQRLSISNEEYEFIMQNYMDYSIEAPYTYNERLEALFELSKIVKQDDRINGSSKNRWLERMGKAIGFNPSNITYIASKALNIVDMNIDLETFKDQIKSINR